jgi:hypothetical protein
LVTLGISSNRYKILFKEYQKCIRKKMAELKHIHTCDIRTPLTRSQHITNTNRKIRSRELRPKLDPLMPVQGATPQNMIHRLIITPATTQRLSNNIYSTQVGPNLGVIRNQAVKSPCSPDDPPPRPKTREKSGLGEILKRHTCPYFSYPIFSANPSTGKTSSEGTSHTPVRHSDTDSYLQQIPSRCDRPFCCHLYQHEQEPTSAEPQTDLLTAATELFYTRGRQNESLVKSQSVSADVRRLHQSKTDPKRTPLNPLQLLKMSHSHL